MGKFLRIYRLELENVNAHSVAEVVEEEFGPIFKAAGCEWVFGDNDKSCILTYPEQPFSFFFAHKCVVKAWAKHGIKVWPVAGVVKDRKTISDFTDLDVDDQGGFPVNSPDCMVLDQSINNTWKNLKYGGLNAKFQRRKPSRKTNGGFVNDVYSSWEEMKTEHIRNAIDTQRGVMTQIIEKQGGPTTFLSSNASK